MYLFLDSFWRAAAYCLRPRVIALSLLPLVIMVALTLVLGYFFWDAALDSMRGWVDSFPYLDKVWEWLERMGFSRLKSVLVPLLVVFCVTPLIVVLSLLAVAWLMTPALVQLVATNRFAPLESKNGGGLASSLVWSLGSVVLAGLAMVVSMPLWLLPPLVVLVPPLIWGWLTYRVMAFDALGTHASKEERRVIFKENAGWLLLMGVVCGYLGASPSAIWAMGTGFAPAFLFLVPVAIWVYTLVFAFASLWFIHFCLGALHKLRMADNPANVGTGADVQDPLVSTALQPTGTSAAPLLPPKDQP